MCRRPGSGNLAAKADGGVLKAARFALSAIVDQIEVLGCQINKLHAAPPKRVAKIVKGHVRARVKRDSATMRSYAIGKSTEPT